MKRAFLLLAFLLSSSVAIAGCTVAGTPRATTPENSVDWGNVPVVVDMSKAKLKTFTIKNEGNADLKLSDIQVKTLEGC